MQNKWTFRDSEQIYFSMQVSWIDEYALTDFIFFGF